MRKTLIFLQALLLFSVIAFSQSRTITGQVKDESGNPVPFATVAIRQTANGPTSTGTSADANGYFSIEAGSARSLVFSSTGFDTKEIALVAGKNEITVELGSSAQLINEVVVTALGIRRNKNELPFAAQQIKGDQVSNTRGSNFVSNLSGKISGLEVRQNNTLGGSTNVVIRGYKSLTSSNQALFVIDGVPVDNSNTNSNGVADPLNRNQLGGRGGYDYGNASADINPDDIESVNVLKGAAATALYGYRASNGVVLITTKKNARGLGVTINSGVTAGFIDKSTFVKYQHQYGGGYGNYYGPDEDAYFNQADANGDGVLDLIVPTTEDASYGGKFDPSLLVYQWNAFDPSSPNYRKATPWVAAANDPLSFFESPVSFNNSVFIDGGSDKGNFKLGYTRTDDKGLLPNSNIRKDLINLGASYNISDKLTATASVNFSKINGRGRYGTGYESRNPATQFRQWWQTNVDVKEQKDAYFRTRKNVTWNWGDPLEENPGPIYWDNIYWTRHENFQNDQRFRYFANASLSYKITDWLNVLGRVALDSYDELQEERIAVGSVDPSEYSRFSRSRREYNYDLLINLDRNISSNLNLKALLGSNIRRTRMQSQFAETNGGLFVERLYSLANSLNQIKAPEEADERIGVDGYFAGVTLTWKEMITLDGTIRQDKASTLPEANNTFYYPAISAGFIFSKLLPDTRWLSFGKVRANYAEVGSGSERFAALNDSYEKPAPFGSTTVYTLRDTKNNADLKPERTKSYEVGLEASFLNSRLGFDVSYYNTQTIDQILPASVSFATGYNFKFVNAGTIKNNGVELSVYATPVKFRDFTWTVNVNWSRNRNKVTELFEGSDNLVIQAYQGGVSINATLGQPYGTLRGENFIYTNGQKTVGANGIYLKSATANEVIGNANPDWIGGVSNTLRYKDLSMGFLVDVRHGGDLFSLDQYYGLATGISEATTFNNDLGNPVRNSLAQGGGVVLPGVTIDGKPNTTRASAQVFGLFGYRRTPAAGFVYDASYVKLREATLTYSIPKAKMARLAPFKGIDFSLVGRNLWIIHKNLPYADPEEGISSGNAQGYQGGAYPTVRQIGFNVKLRF
ncbi:MAG: SusC/RagA family TonB-linked outer membrane protein [Chitinophagaceae bacterium]